METACNKYCALKARDREAAGFFSSCLPSKLGLIMHPAGLLLNPFQPRAPLAATSAAHPWVLGVPVPCWWSGTRCPGASGLPSSWGRFCTRFMGPGQPVQNKMMVSEFDGEKGEGEQGREGGRARSRTGFATVLKGREAGDEVGKGKVQESPMSRLLGHWEKWGGRRGREAELGHQERRNKRWQCGTWRAVGCWWAREGHDTAMGGSRQGSEEADKRLAFTMLPVFPCQKPRSILRLLAPSQHHPQHCRQIAAARVPRGRDSPLCSLTPGLVQSPGREKDQSRACHERSASCVPFTAVTQRLCRLCRAGQDFCPSLPKNGAGCSEPGLGVKLGRSCLRSKAILQRKSITGV